MLAPLNRRSYHDAFEAARHEKLIVVKFTAEWCSACNKIQTELEAYAAANPDIHFIAYDVEAIDHRDGEDVQKLPTFKIFKNRECVDAFTGANMDKLKELVDKHRT